MFLRGCAVRNSSDFRHVKWPFLLVCVLLGFFFKGKRGTEVTVVQNCVSATPDGPKDLKYCVEEILQCFD